MGRRTLLQAIAGAAGSLSGALSAGATSGATAAEADATAHICDGQCRHRTDVHAHYLPPPYKKAMQDAGLSRVDGGMPIPDWSASAHLAMMESRGITTSILSISSPGLGFLDPAPAARLARQVNEAGAALSHDHPGRFGFFASLPISDIAASLAEMAYAFDTLEADGVVLETNAKGLYLGDPHFAPIFDELDRRKAVLYLHPTSPACLDQIGMGFPGPLIEFPFDTARSAVDLIFNGTLKRRPAIRLILSHGGGALPILLSRIAMIADAPFLEPRPEGGSAEVIEQVRKLYFDLALAATPLNFQALLQITEASHLLFGSDYPFATPPAIGLNTSRYIDLLAGLSEDHRRMIEYGTAAELFPRLAGFIRNG